MILINFINLAWNLVKIYECGIVNEKIYLGDQGSDQPQVQGAR